MTEPPKVSLEYNDNLPKKEFYSIVTLKGLETLANTKVAGGNVSLVQMAVGDGNGAYYVPDAKQTALVNECCRVSLNRICVDPEYSNQILLEAAVPEEIGGFFIREVGIIDEQGNLFAVGKYPVTFKPLSESGSGKDLYIRMALGFSEAPNINLYINPNSSLVSADQIENFAFKDFSNVDESLKIHQNFLELQGGTATERYHLSQPEHDMAVALQQLLVSSNKDKELAVNDQGNGYVVIPSKEIFQNVAHVSGNIIEVSEKYSIYIKKVTENITLNFDITKVTVYNKVITFEILIQMPSLVNVLFASSLNLSWLSGDAVEFDEVGNYLLAFRTYDNGKSWLGSFQGKW